MSKKIVLISTTSFGKLDNTPIKMLKEKDIEPILNPYGRKLESSEVIMLGSKVEGLIAGTETLDAETLSQLKNLKVISRCGIGVDNIDLKKAKELKIKVYNTINGPTEAVAELTVCLMLCLLRKIPLMDRHLREGKWDKITGNLLKGKKVGIVGLGKIGKKVATSLHSFKTELYFTDSAIPKKDYKFVNNCSFTELLSLSDIVTIHIPYNKENEYLIDSDEISLMKKSALLINCSRGKIVNEDTLYTALKNGKIAGAALDVFENEPYDGPLRELDNVILTPHIGSYAKEARIRMEEEASVNLLKGLGYV